MYSFFSCPSYLRIPIGTFTGATSLTRYRPLKYIERAKCRPQLTYTAQTYKRKLLEINFIDYTENSTVFRNNINEMVSVTVMFVLEIPAQTSEVRFSG